MILAIIYPINNLQIKQDNSIQINSTEETPPKDSYL